MYPYPSRVTYLALELDTKLLDLFRNIINRKFESLPQRPWTGRVCTRSRGGTRNYWLIIFSLSRDLWRHDGCSLNIHKVKSER